MREWVGVALLLVAAAGVGALLGVFVLARHGESRAALERHIDHQVGALLAGIPQEGSTLGRPDASITLQFFGDLECLTTRNWVLYLLPAIIRRYVRSGTMKIEFRSFKTDTLDTQTFVKQQTAALAAGVQDKLWAFIETFYHEQGREYTPYATESYIDRIAHQVPGLNLAQWHRDREGGRRTEVVVAEDQTARGLGFHDTPAFRIGRTGGGLRILTGRKIVEFFHQRNPVSLIDTRDLERAIKRMA